MRRALALAFAAGVASAACLMAITPTVVASPLVSGKQIKDNSVSSKDLKNGSITAQDISAATLQALRGTNGTNGKNGTNGTNGKDGASAFAPPPAGTVIRGGGIFNLETSGGAGLRYYVPLPFTTRSPLVDGNSATASTPRNLFFGNGGTPTAGSTDVTKCAGTFAEPTAAPGHLCVYVTGVTNVSTIALLSGADSGSLGSDGADNAGFYLNPVVSAAGAALVRFSWAYTAN